MTTLTFTKDKETKGTFRFAEVHADDEHPVSGSLYVSKVWLAQNGKPETITVTLEAN